MIILALYVALIVLQIVFVLVALFAFMTIATGTLSLAMGVPYVRTFSRLYPQIAQELTIEPGDVVYELGSGDGGFSLYLAHRFPEARFVGIERNPILYVAAHIRRFLQGSPSNVMFRRENFFESDLRDATKVYAYLLTTVMDVLLPKCTEELKKARVVSRAFQFSQKHCSRAIRLTAKEGLHGQHMLYVYEFGDYSRV